MKISKKDIDVEKIRFEPEEVKRLIIKLIQRRELRDLFMKYCHIKDNIKDPREDKLNIY